MGQYRNAGASLRTIPVRGANGKTTYQVMKPGEVAEFPDAQVKDLVRKGEFEAVRASRKGSEEDA